MVLRDGELSREPAPFPKPREGDIGRSVQTGVSVASPERLGRFLVAEGNTQRGLPARHITGTVCHGPFDLPADRTGWARTDPRHPPWLCLDALWGGSPRIERDRQRRRAWLVFRAAPAVGGEPVSAPRAGFRWRRDVAAFDREDDCCWVRLGAVAAAGMVGILSTAARDGTRSVADIGRDLNKVIKLSAR